MRTGKIISIIAILTLMICIGSSCLSGDNDSATGAINIMKKVSGEMTDFSYVNLEVMRNDDAFATPCDEVRQSLATFTEALGINFNDINTFSVAGQVIIFGGIFNLDDVRNALMELEGEQEQVKGIEVWKHENNWIALMEDMIMIDINEGQVSDCIDVMSGEYDSLYDNDDLRSTMDRLPDGMMIVCREGELEGTDYDGIVLSAVSTAKKDDQTMNVTGICKFEDEASARDAVADIQSDWNNSQDKNWHDVQLKQDNKFVEINAVQDMEYAFNTGSDTRNDEEVWESDQLVLQSAVDEYYLDNGRYPTNSGQGLNNPLTDNYTGSSGETIGDSCIVFSGDVQDGENNGLVEEGYMIDPLSSSDYIGSGAAKNPGGRFGNYIWFVDSSGTVRTWHDADGDLTLDADELDFLVGVDI